jgi:hypothetical protein
MTTRITLRFPYLAACCAVAAGIAAPSGACAQSDASRYINAQGVEVIQGRRAPQAAPAAAAADTAAGEAPAQVPAARPKAGPAEAGQARKAAFQIAAGEQDARDRDRLAILNEEMRSENAALESKIRILQSPAMRAKLDPEQLKRLQETTLEHERNIRSLTSEINRAKKSM